MGRKWVRLIPKEKQSSGYGCKCPLCKLPVGMQICPHYKHEHHGIISCRKPRSRHPSSINALTHGILSCRRCNKEFGANQNWAKYSKEHLVDHGASFEEYSPKVLILVNFLLSLTSSQNCDVMSGFRFNEGCCCRNEGCCCRTGGGG